MMNHVDLTTLHSLSNEVIDWCRSGQVLARHTGTVHFSHKYEDGEIPFEVRGVSDWFFSTDAHNKDTVFVDLDELISSVEEACRGMHSFGPKVVKNALYDFHESIRQAIVASECIKNVGKKLFEIDNRGMKLVDVIGHIQLTIVNHLATVVDARVLTLSKRYAPCEAIFVAYKQGLFPFGWNWEDDSLWCLDPKSV